MIFYFTLFSKDCRTTNATEIKWHNGTSVWIPDKNTECIFPYEFLGKEYSECTLDHACPGCYWCGTSENVTDHTGWGMCNKICPREKRKFYQKLFDLRLIDTICAQIFN